ncbi:thiamine pyrophosphate-binding protein [Frigoribacterium sp. UYMn621]|uniref:thiamine pyrophosphate-binding protein n=1 Tax=Frigoribacterium sp. UYMn621 TaxID=3156343 RepID=UPI003393E9B7
MNAHVWASHKTGSDLIADFIAARCHENVFVVNGGACVFMIDALGRNSATDYVCVQHEQAAAMSADAIWRTTGKIGVTMVTSGPGATNLITGIASSWFDSIPALHITGQVNDRESKTTIGADVRQAGFQETDIVSMVSTITKMAVKVSTTAELAVALRDAVAIATSGRMGPVVVDVPMNVQQDPVSEQDYLNALSDVDVQPLLGAIDAREIGLQIESFLENAQRPLVIMGGGLGLAGTAKIAQDWCEAHGIPYIASWAGLTYLDRSRPGYQGSQGVYGSRHANWSVQGADRILSLGSRLDNRQRTGNPRAYAPFADIFVVDVDEEEIRKFHANPRYTGRAFDLTDLAPVLGSVSFEYDSQPWLELVQADKESNSSGWEASVEPGELNPYDAVQEFQKYLPKGAIVVSDTGANLCWLFQAYAPDDSYLFTSGGNSPMGYSLPAAIGAQIARPETPVVCVIGDGGLQMNIQELQTAVNYELPITIVVFNNSGYGIIKQFQDSNTSSRYHASGEGYSTPDLRKIAAAYEIPFSRVSAVQDIESGMFERGLKLVEFVVPPQALITPKVEGGHFIHDQFPYVSRSGQQPLPFDYPASPSDLAVSSAL